MYSEFTVYLIEEVKKREILYNTKYEKRPKTEKEQCWSEIAETLNCTPKKAKTHWKNVRDRFVKIMHARERHFAKQGNTNDAPNYIYYEKLNFLKDFSIKKEYGHSYALTIDEIEPDILMSDEGEDYTCQFLENVHQHSSLYDKSADLRKYQGRSEWKIISLSLDSKFTTAKLRDYWIKLIKKYKLWHANRDHLDSIVNEHIFKEMSFVQLDMPEEHITFEFDDGSDSIENYDDIIQDDRSEEPPPPKRLKAQEESIFIETANASPQDIPQNLDEFDFFARKVALQLKQIANKNLNSARKAEIEILKLLMDYEDANL